MDKQQVSKLEHGASKASRKGGCESQQMKGASALTFLTLTQDESLLSSF